MQLKKSKFAAVCGVSRPAIGELVKKGTLRESGGQIDLADPANFSYLSRHNPDLASRIQRGEEIGDSVPAPIPGATRGPASKREKKPPRQPKKPAVNKKKMDEIRAEDARFEDGGDLGDGGDGIPAGLTPAEFAEITRKQLYDAQKAHADAELKRVQLDKEHDSLGERSVFEAFIMELWQSIQQNYIDVIPKQASIICKRLGMVGHELEVIEVLEDDVKKRQDNVAHKIKTILARKMVGDSAAHAEVAE